MKKTITTITYLSFVLTIIGALFFASRAHAAWIYTNYSIPYNVVEATPTNLPPIVDAGPDKVLTQPANSVSVTGTASDPDGTIASTQWTYVSGPGTNTIATPATLTTLISNLNILGTYNFRLTATDNQGLSASDMMQIIVNEPANSPQPDLVAGSSTVVPSAMVGANINLQTTITNLGQATTGAGFSNFFQVASASNGGGTITDLPSVSMTTLVSGASSTTTRSYSFPTAGVRSIRACADKTSSSNSGTITESNEGNNCGPWSNIVVMTNVVNGSCGAAHYSCSAGTSTNNNQGSTEWTWMCTGANGGGTASCMETIPVTFQCSDGIDNDKDGKIDHKDEPTADPKKEGDPGCVSGQDNDEKNAKPIYQEN